MLRRDGVSRITRDQFTEGDASSMAQLDGEDADGPPGTVRMATNFCRQERPGAEWKALVSLRTACDRSSPASLSTATQQQHHRSPGAGDDLDGME